MPFVPFKIPDRFLLGGQKLLDENKIFSSHFVSDGVRENFFGFGKAGSLLCKREFELLASTALLLCG